MALEISYYTKSRNQNIAGAAISAESLTLSATSALSGATPANADIIKIQATENARFDYSSATSTASSTTPYLASGDAIYLDAKPDFKVAGKTA